VAGAESTAVNVGFIGAGNVLPAYLQLLDRLVPRGLAAEGPVCARSEDTAAELRARRPGTRVVATSAELLEDPSVDLVVLITPPGSHPELVRAALEAGKHVVCEKPLARGRSATAELFALARERELILLAAPFVQLSPTFRRLWALVRDGALGRVHAARAHYGNAGSTWASWYHTDPAATLGDVAIYNLKSLAALLGPVAAVQAASAHGERRREIRGAPVETTDPDTWQLLLRHEDGALSNVLASHATCAYRRPAIELYGLEGTANLLGDDWDPAGIELYREQTGSWELIEPEDATWLWADGLREAVAAIREQRAPLSHPDLDVHVHELIEACARAALEGCAVAVETRFAPLEELRPEAVGAGHVHDRTRPAGEQ
jgi:predicted dehydrogenase